MPCHVFLKYKGMTYQKKKKQTITTERNVIKLMPGENQRQQMSHLPHRFLIRFLSVICRQFLSLPPHHFFPELKNSLEVLNPLKIRRKNWTSPIYFREHLLKPAPTFHLPLDKDGPSGLHWHSMRTFSHCGTAQVLNAARRALFVLPGHKISHF